MSAHLTPEPLGYAIFREGRQVGFERTLAVANHWAEAEIVPLCRMSERDELLAALEKIATKCNHDMHGDDGSLGGYAFGIWQTARAAIASVKGGAQ